MNHTTVLAVSGLIGSMFTRKKSSHSGSTVMKNHYHPSHSQPLSTKGKKPTLSPVRSSQRSSPQLYSLQQENQHIAKKHGWSSSTDLQPVFTEVWPTSDCESSPEREAACFETESPQRSTSSVNAGVSSALQGHPHESVLAKYVERFRHGQPQSREERQQMSAATVEKHDSFWWLSPSSLPHNTQALETSDNDNDDHHHYRSGYPCRRSFDTLSDVSQSEFNDIEILNLQERASRLLPRGDGLLSDGSIPVSSEGIGTSEFSSLANEDEPVQRYSIPRLVKPDSVKGSSRKSVIPPMVAPTRPQDDILFQWRSRRRMEQARDWSQSPCSWNTPSLSCFSASGHPHKQSLNTQALDVQPRGTHPHFTAPPPQASGSGPSDVKPPPTPPAFVTPVSHPHSVPHVPAHMHYLCDVLPCPIQSSQNTPQQLEKPETTVIHKKTQITETCGGTVSDVHLAAHFSSSSSSSRAVEGNLQTVSERNNKKEELREESVRTKSKKTSTRVSSHQKTSKNVTPWKEQQHQLRGNQENLSANCSGEPGAPHSPVHSAMGKVVSEVFFPAEDLSPEPQRSGACVPAPSLSSLPPCNSQNSAEVISQLLQEAEDSDEKEFEDDPLLGVLRKQRRWVKGQIRYVDSVLNEVLDKQQVT